MFDAYSIGSEYGIEHPETGAMQSKYADARQFKVAKLRIIVERLLVGI
jgi:hypothetical protein